jgi:hypothetical protein
MQPLQPPSPRERMRAPEGSPSHRMTPEGYARGEGPYAAQSLVQVRGLQGVGGACSWVCGPCTLVGLACKVVLLDGV